MVTIDEHADAVARALGASRPFLPTTSLDMSIGEITSRRGRFRARVLAHDVLAEDDVPRFTNSQMDGFAVRGADLAGASEEHPVRLPARAGGAAGASADPLPSGTAAEVMTGAPVPEGADAIVPVERTEPGFFGNADVTFTRAPDPGEFIRPQGADITAGEVLATAGTPLRPPHLGAFAAAGVPRIDVFRRLRVSIITTGHELRDLGDDLEDSSVYDAVGGMLAAAMNDAGASARVLTVHSDDPDIFATMIDLAAGISDLIVTVGGVSRGAYEVVKLALAPRGVEFTHVAMQPGGPQGLGQVDDDGRAVPVVCFPGNPVSAITSYEVFLRPVLRERAGLRPAHRPRVSATLAEGWDSPDHHHQLRRAILREDGTVVSSGGPGSHLIAHYSAANALAHVPVGTTRLEPGDEVEVWRIDD